MATRTPPLQTRSQFGRSWGNFASATALPNASGAPLGAPFFSILEVGDTAYSVADGATYTCTSVGTAGGGNAIWSSAEERPTVVTSVSTSISLVAGSDREIIRTSAGSTVTVAVPSLPAGTIISFVQEGAGQIQFSASGVALRHPSDFLARAAGQWSFVTLLWLTTTSVLVVGDLELAP